jgi:hypothetical protein
MERGTKNAGRQREKKIAIDQKMGGDGQECLDK